MEVFRAKIMNCWNDTTPLQTDSARMAGVLSCLKAVSKATDEGDIHVVGVIREKPSTRTHGPVRDSARAKLPLAIQG